MSDVLVSQIKEDRGVISGGRAGAPVGIKWLLVKEDSTLCNMALERLTCMLP